MGVLIKLLDLGVLAALGLLELRDFSLQIVERQGAAKEHRGALVVRHDEAALELSHPRGPHHIGLCRRGGHEAQQTRGQLLKFLGQGFCQLWLHWVRN